MMDIYKILMIAIISVLFSSEPFSDYKIGKDYFIKKIENKIDLDGLMAEKIWSDLDPIDDYVQYFPSNGDNPSLRTEVRMFYTDRGIYIYARMFDDQPNKIQKRLSKRDDLNSGFIESSDWIMFSFDSRHDHQTGYIFAVNCSGVQADGAIYDDIDYDIEYSSLWYAETNIDNLGWTAELFLPFSSFNFDSQMGEKWGFNIKRYIYRLNEVNNWVSFPLEVKGISSQFGHLIGFSDIQANKEVEFKPFISIDRGSEKQSKLPTDQYGYITDGFSNEFYESTLDNNNMGFDIKYNINTQSAINFSFKPDFGQVEVDPADINISYYETYLNEKRPFFIENSTMFNLPIEMFYSRRIGEVKNISYNAEIPTYIDVAFKLSGKESNGFSYGLIAASTKNDSPDSLTFNPLIPESNKYYTLRLKQDLFDGNSFVGLSVSSFDGLRGDYRILKDEQGAPVLNQFELENPIFNSSSFSIDGVFNFLDNRLYSDFQLAYAKTDESDYAYSIQSIYDINRFWSINLDLESIGQNFNNNDMGYLYRNDINSQKFEVSYQDLDPNGRFQERYASLNLNAQNNNSNNLQLLKSVSLSIGGLLKNSSHIYLGITKNYSSYDDRLIYDYKQDQLGVSMYIPESYGGFLKWSSDNRLVNSFSIGFGWGENDIDDWGYNIRYSHVYRPDYNIKLSFDYEFYKSKEKYHWLDIVGTENPHYIFSNANNELHKYVMRFEAFLNKDITWQNYIEIIQSDNQFSNWMELQEGARYPEQTNFTSGLFLYADEGSNPNPAFGQTVNPNDDIYFFSDYTELVYNAVLKWQITNMSELYVIYTRYWLTNGSRIASLLDLINEQTYELDDKPWTEKTFDLGISIKYVRQFNL
tara:strand:+ start:2462 stop:5062 length:2601 start_codon:yes stop_codon:yes gene_type:complete